MPDSTANASPTRPGRRRFWFGVFLVVLGLIVMAPTVIAKTSLRDRLINAAIADESLEVTTREASFGYLSPFSIHGFQLRAQDGSMKVKVEAMEADKSWLKMLLSDGDLGGFRFREPTVELVTGIAKEETPAETEVDVAAEPAKTIAALPTLTAEVLGAGVQVRNVASLEPAIDLKDVDFTIHVEQGDHGSVVLIEPAKILDEETLTPQLCNQGVQLIAPMLSDVVDVQGRISFDIDKFSVPVGGDPELRRQQSEISGTVKLSDVSVSLKNQITEQLVPLLNRIGAIQGDLAMTVSESTEVSFQVVDGRVHHQGLMFLLPVADSSFELQSSGSVGFDESLDLQLAVGLPGKILGNSMLAKFFTDEPMVIEVTGTVDEPKIGLASNDGWAGRLQGVLNTFASKPERADETGTAEQPEATTGREIENAAGAVLDVVGGLLEQSGDRDQPLFPNLRDQIRDRRQEPQRPRRLLPRRRQADPPPEPTPL